MGPGQVIDDADSLERRGQPIAAGQVADDRLDAAPQILGQPSGAPDQHPDCAAPIEELTGQLLADEAGRAQDQDLGARPGGRRGRLRRGLDPAVAATPAVRAISSQVRITSRPSSGDSRRSIVPGSPSPA